MPECMQLIDKTTNETACLLKVDEEVCALLNADVHPKRYGGTGVNAFNWYDSIGFQIANLRADSFEPVRKYYSESSMWKEEWPTLKKIIDFLESKYQPRGFRQGW